MSERTVEDISNFEQEKERKALACEEYLAETPELQQILKDFTVSCLALKPKDIEHYAEYYFSQLKAKKQQEEPKEE